MFPKFFVLPWKLMFCLLTLKLHLLQWKISPLPHILTSTKLPVRKSRNKAVKNNRVSVFFRSVILTPEPIWQIELIAFCNILFHCFHYSGHCSLASTFQEEERGAGKSFCFRRESRLTNSEVKAAFSCHRLPCRFPRPILVGPTEVLAPFRRMLIFIDGWTSLQI